MLRVFTQSVEQDRLNSQTTASADADAGLGPDTDDGTDPPPPPSSDFPPVRHTHDSAPTPHSPEGATTHATDQPPPKRFRIRGKSRPPLAQATTSSPAMEGAAGPTDPAGCGRP
eukprot:2291606-Amphidinium_carterae.1